MIKPEQIPDEVVEAAARALCSEDCGSPYIWHEVNPRSRHRYKQSARAAIAAALNAWPDSEIHNFDGTHFAEAIVLPLPAEASDE